MWHGVCVGQWHKIVCGASVRRQWEGGEERGWAALIPYGHRGSEQWEGVGTKGIVCGMCKCSMQGMRRAKVVQGGVYMQARRAGGRIVP